MIRFALWILKRAMRSEDYSWTWQSNLAMAAFDAMPVTVGTNLERHKWANEGAAAFMYRLFGCDLFEHPYFLEFENVWKAGEK